MKRENTMKNAKIKSITMALLDNELLNATKLPADTLPLGEV
jgi:hypothetical protein